MLDGNTERTDDLICLLQHAPPPCQLNHMLFYCRVFVGERLIWWVEISEKGRDPVSLQSAQGIGFILWVINRMIVIRWPISHQWHTRVDRKRNSSCLHKGHKGVGEVQQVCGCDRSLFDTRCIPCAHYIVLHTNMIRTCLQTVEESRELLRNGQRSKLVFTSFEHAHFLPGTGTQTNKSLNESSMQFENILEIQLHLSDSSD